VDFRNISGRVSGKVQNNNLVVKIGVSNFACVQVGLGSFGQRGYVELSIKL